jgi:membrane-associated phospholipid phosphatase
MSVVPPVARKTPAILLLVATLLASPQAGAQSASDEGPSGEPPASLSPQDGIIPLPEVDAPPSSDPGSADLDAADGEELAQEVPYWRKNLFSRFFKDQAFLFRTWIPSEIHNPAFSIPFVTTTALAISSSRDERGGYDAQLEGAIRGDARTRTAQGSARFFSEVGNTAAGAVLIGAGYLFGRLSGHDKMAEASSLSAEAVLTAGLWSSTLKALTARTRPAGGATGNFFDYHPSSGQVVGSFPSGHATGAFAVATVFSGVYSDHKWVPWLAYGTAGMVGLSRLALSRHFPTDVVAGALFGNSMGRMVLARRDGTTDRRSSFQPIAGPQNGDVGLAWNYSW